ncbi:hypothetical protein KCU62_g489, partial [Aureobasidium sp. EXF-3399]
LRTPGKTAASCLPGACLRERFRALRAREASLAMELELVTVLVEVPHFSTSEASENRTKKFGTPVRAAYEAPRIGHVPLVAVSGSPSGVLSRKELLTRLPKPETEASRNKTPRLLGRVGFMIFGRTFGGGRVFDGVRFVSSKDWRFLLLEDCLRITGLFLGVEESRLPIVNKDEEAETSWGNCGRSASVVVSLRELASLAVKAPRAATMSSFVWLIVQDAESANLQAFGSGDWHTGVKSRSRATSDIWAVAEARILCDIVDDVDDVRRVFVLRIGTLIGRQADRVLANTESSGGVILQREGAGGFGEDVGVGAVEEEDHGTTHLETDGSELAEGTSSELRSVQSISLVARARTGSCHVIDIHVEEAVCRPSGGSRGRRGRGACRWPC